MKGLAKVATAVLLLVEAAAAATTRSQRDQDRVLLEQVKVITLHDSRYTAGRRSAPVPQLVCQGGCGQWTPNTVQCYNMGSDGTDAAWKCEATLPDGYSFSSVEVGCEGYDYPEDPYILKGSCQLIYSLKGPRENQNNGRPYDDDGSWASSQRTWEDGNNPTWDERSRNKQAPGTEKGFGSRLMTWAALGVFGYVFFNMFFRHVPSGHGPSSPGPGGMGDGGPGGAGGGGWGGWGGGGWGGGGGNNWRGGRTDNNSSGPPKGGSFAPTAPPPPAPAQERGGVYPWLAGGGIGAAVAYMMRPRQRRNAPVRGGMAWNQGHGMGNVGGRGDGDVTVRRRTGGGGGGGGSVQAGFGGTSRR